MFISHADILWSKTHDLKDPAWCQEVAQRIMPKGAADDWDLTRDWLSTSPCTMLIQYLRQLPPLEKLEKIVTHLHEVATAYDAKITRLEWWDIEMSKRHLMLYVTRQDGREVKLLLMWKKSEKDPEKARRSKSIMSGMFGWALDRNAPDSWRFEIECEVFDHIKDGAFPGWLKKELPAYHYLVA